jgi:hypothetical protein
MITDKHLTSILEKCKEQMNNENVANKEYWQTQYNQWQTFAMVQKQKELFKLKNQIKNMEGLS